MKSRDEIIKQAVKDLGWCCEYAGEPTDIADKALNLAIPPGHVVVKVEDLRAKEYSGVRWHDGKQMHLAACPACKTYKDEEHRPDCWLAAALKEGES